MKKIDRELFYAVRQGSLGEGAKGYDGETPLGLARKEGHAEIVNILGGAKPKVVERRLSNVYFDSEKAQELDKKYSGDELETAKKDIVGYFKYRKSCIYLVTGKDRGKSAWHCVLVDRDKNEMLLEKCKTDSVDVADYGEIVYSGWGQDPPQDVRDEIDKFFDKRISNDLFVIKEEHKGKSLYHYVLVYPDKKEMFLERSKRDPALVREIEDYGRVLYSGWGQDPPESISDRIERAYFCMDERDLEGEFTNLSVKDGNALHDAARNGELGTVRDLMRNGVNVNSADKNGWTPLHHAAYGGSLGVVKYLMDNGADFHAKDTICGREPIHIAAREGYAGIVKLFLSRDVRVSDIDDDKNGWTLLHYAAWSGCLGVIELLINEGANIHDKEVTRGKKPIHVAVGRGHINAVKLFLSDIGIEDTDKEGRTSLYYAAWKGELDTVKFLIDGGANVHAENTYGTKPIHVAALEGYQEIIKFLLSKGIDIDDTNKKHGCTPLHCASQEGELGVVEFLIKEGANIHAKDNYGETPLDTLEKMGTWKL